MPFPNATKSLNFAGSSSRFFLFINNTLGQQAALCFQALKSIKTSEFMPYVVFVAAPPVEILRNMHELALQRGKTNRVKTVSTALMVYFPCRNRIRTQTRIHVLCRISPLIQIQIPRLKCIYNRERDLSLGQ